MLLYALVESDVWTFLHHVRVVGCVYMLAFLPLVFPRSPIQNDKGFDYPRTILPLSKYNNKNVWVFLFFYKCEINNSFKPLLFIFYWI